MSTQHQFALDFTQKRPAQVQAAIADGMKQADDNANHFWKRMLDAAIVAVARRMPELTVDDVLDEMERIPNCPTNHSLDALGPAMCRASRDKIIVSTNKVVRSTRPHKHGNRRNVWRSLHFGGDL